MPRKKKKGAGRAAPRARRPIPTSPVQEEAPPSPPKPLHPPEHFEPHPSPEEPTEEAGEPT